MSAADKHCAVGVLETLRYMAAIPAAHANKPKQTVDIEHIMPLEPSANAVKSLEQELVILLAMEGKKVPVPVFITAAMIAALAFPHVSALLWAPWLVLVAAMLVLRWIALSRLPGMAHLSGQQQLRIAVLLSGLHGLLHASSLFFIPYLPEFERAIQSMLLVAMCTAGIATSAGYKPVFWHICCNHGAAVGALGF